MKSLIVKGAMGGGQQQTVTKTITPTEANDTLRSTQMAWIFDVLSEGPILGICDRNWNPLPYGPQLGRGVFFDKTQLITDSGALNFGNIQVGEQLGYPVQGTYTSISTASDTVSVGVEIKRTLPHTISIEDPNTTRVSVGLRFGGLQQQDSHGNIIAMTVNFAIFVSLNGGPFGLAVNYNLTGKSSGDYVQEFNIQLPHSADPQHDYWQVQVQRGTPDDTDSKHRSPFIFDYYTRIVGANLMYPNTAYAVIGIDSRTMSTIPTRSFRVKGRLINVPSNYFPETRQYTRYYANGGNTGVEQPWNGTFYQAWSNNPAWVFYDMCTNTRYGAGEFIGTSVDKWALYSIAQYCDELVPDGYGRLEPRMTCNTFIQTQEQAYKVLADLASVFRGLIYWGQGTIVPVQDRPKPMIQVFTNANVVDAMFHYSDTEIKNRQSDATVSWADPDDFYATKYERTSHQDARKKFGFREANFAAFGCASKGQATRAGLYFLYTNQTETETVVFQTGFEAMYLRPGDIIGIMDNDRVGQRRGGRVADIDASRFYITLDVPIAAFPDGQQIYFYNAVYAPTKGDPFNNSNEAKNEHPPQVAMGYIRFMGGLASRTIHVDFGATVGNTQQPGQPNSGQPAPQWIVKGCVFTISSNYYTPNNLPVATYRIISIAEKDTHIYEISGVTYAKGKYDAIDFGVQFSKPLITALPPVGKVLVPNNLTFTLQEKITQNQGGIAIWVILQWEQPPDPYFRSSFVSVSANGGAWQDLGEQAGVSYGYLAPSAGSYTFHVQSVNVAGIRSAAVSVTAVVPSYSLLKKHRISGLEIRNQGNNSVFTTADPIIQWRLNSPIRVYEFNTTEPSGASTGNYDPYFVDFEVAVYDALTNKLGWVDHTTGLTYQITRDKNAGAWPDKKARHKLKVTVQARNSLNLEPEPREIVIDNPAPDTPRMIAVTTAPGSGRVTLQWRLLPAIDITKVFVYFQSSGNAIDAIKLDEVSANQTSYITPPLTTGTTYYFALSAVDSFGTESPATDFSPITIT